MKQSIRRMTNRGVLLSLLFLLGASSARGADLYVSASGLYDGHEAYTDLQQAIRDAQTGDTVWVENGFVCDTGKTVTDLGASRIFIDKDIVVRSRSGSWKKPAIIRGVIDKDGEEGRFGPNSVRCALMQNKKSTFVGFKFENGSVQSKEAENYNSGGGIGGFGQLRSCLVTGNSARRGGGIAAIGGQIIFESCVISNNYAVNYSGGVFKGIGIDSQIICNESTYFAGGFTDSYLTNCLIASNVSSNHCGGGHALDTPLSHCVISNNFSGGDGGGVAYSPTLDHCTIISNVAARNGGGLYGWAQSCRCTATDSVLIGNRAEKSGGGAMNLIAKDCKIEGNSCAGNGGGVNGGWLENCLVSGNVASNATEYGMGNGGGLYSATATNCLIRNNFASSGSVYSHAIGCGGGASKGIDGHGLIGCIVTNNAADSRGGALSGCDSRNCVFCDNKSLTANSEGGALFGGAHYNALVIGNRTNGKAAAAGWKTLLVNCTLADNIGSTTLNFSFLLNTVLELEKGKASGRIDWATNCCSTIGMTQYGTGNIKASPKLGTEGNFRYVPLPGSPCLNAGLVQPWMTDPDDIRSHDLNGRRRVIDTSVDIGAFEAPFWGTKLLLR